MYITELTNIVSFLSAPVLTIIRKKIRVASVLLYNMLLNESLSMHISKMKKFQ
jgi:hypothetical protein